MKKPIKKKTARRVEEIKELFDPKAARKFEREAENALIDLEEKTDAVYAFAREIYLFQDEKTRGVIAHMVEKMKGMAGPPNFKFRGQPYPADMDRQRDVQNKLFIAFAIRLLTACALWDIQIANFKLPPDRCAKCGKPVKSTKPKKKRSV
jgi:hypothetical protein